LIRETLANSSTQSYRGVMTVEAIKDAITELEKEERLSLATWLNGLDNDEWDEQMARDFSLNGRGMPLVGDVRQQIAEGQSLPFKPNPNPR